MRRVQSCLAVVVLLTALPLYAQSKAKVQNVPEIPYDSGTYCTLALDWA